jgi:hypothetical protein
MSSQLEIQAAKVTVGLSGLLGSKAVHALDVDKIVTVANMKLGTYTIAAQPTAPSRITVSHTAVGAVDTLGTINFIGTLPDGTVIHEKVTPVDGATVSTVNEFASVTSATGAGWVIGEGNDTITIGVGAVIPDSFYFNAITNRIVASANMKVGAYTVAAQPLTPGKLTIATVAAGAADTMGTIKIFGTLTDDTFITETIIPVSGQTVTTTNIFKSVITVTGAGWVISAGNDTIMVGTAEVSVPTTNYFSAIQSMADTVVSTQEDVTGATNPALSTFTSILAGTVIYGKFSSITLTSGQAIAYKAAL